MKKTYISVNKDRENEKWSDKPNDSYKAQKDRKNKRHKLEEEDEYRVQRNNRKFDNTFNRHASRAAMGYELDEFPDY